MNYSFNGRSGLIIVSARLLGPSGSAILRLALDTGATSTLINTGLLVAMGYDPASALERIQITTGSGVEFVPRITVTNILALGHEVEAFPLLGHTLPPSASVDGLLGLDFFRRNKLTLNFRRQTIRLE